MNNAMGKNGTDRLAKRRVATTLKFVNNAVSAKHNKSRVPVVCNALSLGSRGHYQTNYKKKKSQLKRRLKKPTESRIDKYFKISLSPICKKTKKKKTHGGKQHIRFNKQTH